MTDVMKGLTAFVEQLWNEGSFGWIVAILVVATIFALALGVLWLFALLLTGAAQLIVWLINRRHCTHCGNWTTDRSEGEYPECPRGQVCCSSCTFQHRMDHEPTINCPIGGEIMDKMNINDEFIADICPNGHGIWLSNDEFDGVKNIAYINGHSVGHSQGLATGIIIS